MNFSNKDNSDSLLEECDVETYGASGPGGQNVNRRATAVRLRHRPTGIVVTCQRERSQHRNKQIALDILRWKLDALSRPRKKRVATKMSRAVRERILKRKHRQSEKKRLRRKPSDDS